MLIFQRQAVHKFSNDVFSYRFILIETMEALLKYCFHLLTCYDNWLSLDFWEGTIEQLLNITQWMVNKQNNSSEEIPPANSFGKGKTKLQIPLHQIYIKMITSIEHIISVKLITLSNMWNSSNNFAQIHKQEEPVTICVSYK